MTSPATTRAVRSRDKLREAGGRVTSIRLSPAAVRRIEAMIAAGVASNQTEAIERALEMAAADD